MSDISIATFDPSRVLNDLATLRAMGAYKTGVHRPTLSDDHVASLNWLASQLPAARLTPTIDGIGNVLGTSNASGKLLLAGSHLESQNQAGWLDGALGVVYALEAARVINTASTFDGAVEVAAWCDEEGHFGNFLGSASYVGDLTETEIDAAVDRSNGRTLRATLANAGYAGRPRMTVTRSRHMGYIEAHIEQGDWLETYDLKIGIVSSIVGIWQFKLIVTGTQNHAGTTRMAIRHDAGLAAVKLLKTLDETFTKAAGPRTVWTTGRITLDPGAPSIIPGRAEILFQFRDEDPELLRDLEKILRETAAIQTQGGPCPIEVQKLRGSTPAKMDEHFQQTIQKCAATYANGRSVVLQSGAGHDAQILSQVMPAAMLFVPSIGGISHHWTENTADDDIVTGARVFVATCATLLSAAQV